jgi:hypothetical protein
VPKSEGLTGLARRRNPGGGLVRWRGRWRVRMGERLGVGFRVASVVVVHIQ